MEIYFIFKCLMLLLSVAFVIASAIFLVDLIYRAAGSRIKNKIKIKFSDYIFYFIFYLLGNLIPPFATPAIMDDKSRRTNSFVNIKNKTLRMFLRSVVDLFAILIIIFAIFIIVMLSIYFLA